MTFTEYFESFRKKFEGVDVSDIEEHLAFQFTIEDAEAGGTFYVEVKDGQLYIEPYDYHDRDTAFFCSPATLDKIISGKTDPIAAFTLQKLRVEGDLGKALRLKGLIAKKTK